MTVILDNGHGSNTPGKCSPDKKLKEWAWCREMVKLISAELTKLGIKNKVLVPEDKDISITERCKRANAIAKLDKCILVSVHLNASGNGSAWGSAKGWSVFCSKNASANSKKLASLMTEVATSEKLLGNRSVPKEKFWTWSWTTADIAILKNTSCPAVLTENMFMDNKEDAAFLMSAEGKLRLMQLHVTAIKNYLK